MQQEQRKATDWRRANYHLANRLSAVRGKEKETAFSVVLKSPTILQYPAHDIDLGSL